MNKTIFVLMFVAVLLVGSVSAMKINYYHYKINQSDCKLTLESVPVRYYEGIRVINQYIYPQRRLGNYLWYSNIINIYDNCNLKTLIHELSHHNYKIEGISFLDSKKHGKEFKMAEEEIWLNLN